MMIARGAAFEFGMPAVHGFGTDAGGAEHGDPHGFIDGGGGVWAVEAEQRDEEALLDAERADFVIDPAQALFEEAGGRLSGGLEEGSDVGKGNPGGTVAANAFQAATVLRRIQAVAGAGAVGGGQQADAVVVQQGAAREADGAGQFGDAVGFHGRGQLITGAGRRGHPPPLVGIRLDGRSGFVGSEGR